ncbi:hypothetical protein GEMRC1_002575 [Eukaryota sp. GEM-RC1]
MMFFSQFCALTRAAFRIQGRSWRGLIIQLFLVPLLFVLMLQIFLDFFNTSSEALQPFPTRPDVPVLNYIPKCKPSVGKSSCYSIAYVPPCPLLDDIVDKIRQESGLTQEEVTSFASLADLDEYALKNPNVTQFAYVFHDLDTDTTEFPTDSPINYTIVSDNSVWVCSSYDSLNCQLDSVNGIHYPAKLIMDRHITSSVLDLEVITNFSLKRSVHPPLMGADAFSLMGRSFIFFVYLILSLTFLSTLIGEKESGVKMMLSLTSMRSLPHFLSHLVVCIVNFIVVTLTFWGLGHLFDITVYQDTPLTILLTHFIFTAVQLFCLSFLLSVFFRSTRAGVLAGFAFIMVAFLVNMIVVNLYVPAVGRGIQVAFTWFPTVPCELGFYVFASVAFNDDVISWGEINTAFGTSVYSILDIWILIIRNSFVFGIIALYLDNVLSSGGNFNRPWLFPFSSSFWTRKTNHQLNDASLNHPEDYPVILKRLHKKFGKFVAVEDLCLKLSLNEVFCLLGPNGAGKTTAIKACLALENPTAGGAFVLGQLVEDVPNSDLLRQIGYCPQFDCLIPQLTFKEHLILFARVKGLGGNQANVEADRLLKEVRLDDVSGMLAGNGSGGMKRRLSIAISLIGNPKFVVLDEPTTGLDVRVRADIWKIISSIKKIGQCF